MNVLDFVHIYWAQIMFFAGFVIGFMKFALSMIEAIKCGLRNDILEIYDRCKENKQITEYQLQAILHSSEIYFKLKGNSFVKEVVEKVKDFEVIS